MLESLFQTQPVLRSLRGQKTDYAAVSSVFPRSVVVGTAEGDAGARCAPARLAATAFLRMKAEAGQALVRCWLLALWKPLSYHRRTRVFLWRGSAGSVQPPASHPRGWLAQTLARRALGPRTGSVPVLRELGVPVRAQGRAWLWAGWWAAWLWAV